MINENWRKAQKGRILTQTLETYKVGKKSLRRRKEGSSKKKDQNKKEFCRIFSLFIEIRLNQLNYLNHDQNDQIIIKIKT